MTAAATLSDASPGARPETRIHVVQGEHRVASSPEVVLSTILGSCVAACMRDPVAGIGGMNHFLLPDGEGTGPRSSSVEVGVHAMELLVNGLLREGARRERLEAKLFGGARMIAGLSDIGGRNADFAETFLRREGIAYLGGSLRGRQARRIQFWPTTGRARQFVVERPDEVIAAERRPAAPPADTQSGSLELF